MRILALLRRPPPPKPVVMNRHSPRMPWLRPCCRLALVLLLALAPPRPALAGAWPQPEDGGFVTLPLAPYEARTQGFDRRGVPNGYGTQRALELAPYWEHGLTARWTVGLQPRLTAIWLNEAGNHGRNLGVSEVQAFARYNIHLGDRDAFSIQGQVGSPGLAQRDRNPSLAEPNATYELRLLYGRGIPLAPGVNAFFETQAGYRFRSGPAADVVYLNTTIGIRPVAEWALWVQSITDLGMRNGRGFGADYSVQRINASIAWDVTARSTLALSYIREVAGRHVPLGQGAVLAYWYRY